MDANQDVEDLIIRPIRRDDLDSLCQIANSVGYGFTSLPNNREFQANKIELSLQSFKQEAPKHG